MDSAQPRCKEVTNLEMQSDLGSSLAFLQLIQQWFFSEHRSVDMARFAVDLGNITNFGLQTLYKDALDSFQTKRSLYGRGLLDISERSLALMGVDVRPSINWPAPLPFNDAEEIAGIQTEMALGILSKQTAPACVVAIGNLGRSAWQTKTVGQDDIGTRILAAFERRT